MTELLVAAGPVFSVAGETKGELARDCQFLRIEETTGGLRSLEMELTAIGPDPGGTESLLWLDGAVLDFGTELEVALGPADEARKAFRGLVSALEVRHADGRPPVVVVYAEDEMMSLRQTRRSRTYRDTSDADIASRIAQDHGLQADVQAQGPTYDVVHQWNQSDLAFLRMRGRLLQAEVWVEEGTLHFATRGARSGTELSLTMGYDLMRCHIRADLAHQRSAVTVSGYDASRRERIEERAGGDVVQAEISGGRTGPDVLERAFGERVSHRVREAPLTSDEAGRWAEAEMLRRARGFVTATGVTRGSPDMVVGSRLTLNGVGGPFEGDGWYVTSLCHTWDLAEGFRTRFQAERAMVNEQ
jgi:phage protein D